MSHHDFHFPTLVVPFDVGAMVKNGVGAPAQTPASDAATLQFAQTLAAQTPTASS